MNLCGTYWPAEPYAWPAIVVASLVFLLPTLIPWRFAAIAVLAILTLMIGIMALDALDGVYRIVSPGGHRDICDPPYFDAEALKVTAASLWALAAAAVTLFLLPDWRAAEGFTRKLIALSKPYAVSVLPAFLLIFTYTASFG